MDIQRERKREREDEKAFFFDFFAGSRVFSILELG
jgi:hypothetical protein